MLFHMSASSGTSILFPVSSSSRRHTVKTHLEENKRPLEDLFADEDDINSVLKVRAFFAQASGEDVNNVIGKQH
jgi:hypothetical protein